MTGDLRVWRALVARLTNAIVWRSPQRVARMLFSFANAQAASLVDLMIAARLTPSRARRTLYLRHALDEARHARLFTARSEELRGSAPLPPQTISHPYSGDLYERLGEVRFLALVHRGEQRGRRRFESYRAHFGRRLDHRMSALFDVVLADRRRHERYTGALLREMAGGEREAARALRSAAAWDTWRIWRRAASNARSVVLIALLLAAILLVATGVLPTLL
jgi:hypothetical protein